MKSLYWNSVHVMTDQLFLIITFGILIIYRNNRIEKDAKQKVKNIIFMGILSGLLLLTREQGILLIFVIFLTLIGSAIFGRENNGKNI